EAGSEHAAGEHEHEEDRLDAGGAGAERSERGVDGREHTEHRQGLGVHAAFGELGQHDHDDEGEDPHEHEGSVRSVLHRPRFDLHQQGPDEHHQPGDRGRGQHGRGARADADGLAGTTPAPGREGAHVGTDSSAVRTSSTVSHGGPRIFETCGAKDGDAATALEVEASVTISPSASTTTRCAVVATNSTSWVATTTAWFASARSSNVRARAALAG